MSISTPTASASFSCLGNICYHNGRLHARTWPKELSYLTVLPLKLLLLLLLYYKHMMNKNISSYVLEVKNNKYAILTRYNRKPFSINTARFAILLLSRSQDYVNTFSSPERSFFAAGATKCTRLSVQSQSRVESPLLPCKKSSIHASTRMFSACCL